QALSGVVSAQLATDAHLRGGGGGLPLVVRRRRRLGSCGREDGQATGGHAPPAASARQAAREALAPATAPAQGPAGGLPRRLAQVREEPPSGLEPRAERRRAAAVRRSRSAQAALGERPKTSSRVGSRFVRARTRATAVLRPAKPARQIKHVRMRS